MDPGTWTSRFELAHEHPDFEFDGAQIDIAIVWPKSGNAPSFLKPLPTNLPWGLVPEPVGAALDLDEDGVTR